MEKRFTIQGATSQYRITILRKGIYIAYYIWDKEEFRAPVLVTEGLAFKVKTAEKKARETVHFLETGE